MRAVSEAARLALKAVSLSERSLSHTCVALAGYYPPWHEREAVHALGAVLPAVRLVPDLVAAWAGATGGEAGVVLVAGTGAVAYGRDRAGLTARAGGWGPLFGDEGGGYWIGCAGLSALARAVDGRGAATDLLRALGIGHQEKSSDQGTEAYLRAIYREGWDRAQIAALAIHVAQCADAGDAAASGIMTRAAAELGSLIAAVAQRLDWRAEPLPVSAVGGLMAAGTVLTEPLERWLAAVLPNAHWKAPLGSPLDGAMLLAEQGDGGP